jgi:hypothetical protein
MRGDGVAVYSAHPTDNFFIAILIGHIAHAAQSFLLPALIAAITTKIKNLNH